MLDRWRDAAGACDRAPVGGEAAIERHSRRSLASLLGFVRPAAFPNRSALGDQADSFASDVTFVGELARR